MKYRCPGYFILETHSFHICLYSGIDVGFEQMRLASLVVTILRGTWYGYIGRQSLINQSITAGG